MLFIGATVYGQDYFMPTMPAQANFLWQYELPFAGMATPSTYTVAGKQYVVTVASGGRDPKRPIGGAYLAFALSR